MGKEIVLPNELQTELECERDKNRLLSERLEDKILIANNTVMAFNAQKDLLLAKEDIIENLRKGFSDIEKSCNCKQQKDIAEISMTSNKVSDVDTPAESCCDDLNHLLQEKTKNLEIMSEKHQLVCNDLEQQISVVSETKEKYSKTCELLEEYIEANRKWEKKTGSLQEILVDEVTPLYNNVLVWLSTQLDMTNEATIIDTCMNHFVEEEIVAAKSALFDVCGGDGTIIGTKELRRGGVKETKMMKDFKDIVDAMKKLQTSDEIHPLFVTSSEGIMKCPTIIPISNSIKDDAVVNKVSELEKAMSDFMKEQRKHNDRVNGRLESIQKENSVKKLAEQFKEMDNSLEAFRSDLSAVQSGNNQIISSSPQGIAQGPVFANPEAFVQPTPRSRQYQDKYNHVPQRNIPYQHHNQVFTGGESLSFEGRFQSNEPQERTLVPELKNRAVPSVIQVPSIYTGKPPVMAPCQIVPGFVPNNNIVGNVPTRSTYMNTGDSAPIPGAKPTTYMNAVSGSRDISQSVSSSSNATGNKEIVLTGVGKLITAEVIVSYAAARGILVLSCELMTKWEKARANTFKLIIKEQHAGIALSDSVWPLGVTAREFELRINTRKRVQQNVECGWSTSVGSDHSRNTRFTL